MAIKDNYRYSINLNQWALVEYYKTLKISIAKEKNILKKVTSTHYVLLSFFIQCCVNDTLNKLDVNGVIYTQIDDSLILDNLPLFTDHLASKNTRVNKLKKWVKRLEDFGFIKRYTYRETMRYVTINQTLLYKLNMGSIPLPPLDFLERGFKKELDLLEKEYSSKLYYKGYDNLKESFFDERHYDMAMSKEYYTDPQDLLSKFKLYLEKCLNE